MKKFLFTSMIVTLLLIMCLPITVFGDELGSINLKLSNDDVLTWNKISNSVQTLVNITTSGGTTAWRDSNYSSNSLNIKEEFDRLAKESDAYKVQIFVYMDANHYDKYYGELTYNYTNNSKYLDTPSNLRWDGKIARWNDVDNATNYEVHVCTNIGSGQYKEETSKPYFDFSSKMIEDGYYYTVTATAKGYKNSSKATSPRYKATNETTTTQTEPANRQVNIRIINDDTDQYSDGCGKVSVTYGNGAQDLYRSEEITMEVAENATITLKARAEDGYKFLRWEQGVGRGKSTISTETVTQYEITKWDTIFTAYFEKDTSTTEQPTQTEQPTTKEYTIYIAVAEENNENFGTVYLKTDKGTKDFSKGSNLKATEGSKIEIKAKANDGYKFDKWEVVSLDNGKVVDTLSNANSTLNVTGGVQLVAYFSKIETTTEQPTQIEEPAKTEEPVKTEEPAKIEQPTQTEQPKEKTWIKASEWAEEELDKADEIQIIPNKLKYADLTANITRAEFAHVAVKLYEKLTGNKAVVVANNPFIDTADEEVLKAYNLEITKGTSEVTFNPDALITREQMATMMTRAVTKSEIDTKVDLDKVTKFADDGEMHDWGKESIYYMSSIEIIKGVGNNTFNVLGNATREQALLISERSAEKFAK